MRRTLIMVIAMVIGLVASMTAFAQDETEGFDPSIDDIEVIRDDSVPAGPELSVRMNENFGDFGAPPYVLLASAATFADALGGSAGVTGGPLLLVEPELPFSPRVAAELERMRPEQVIFLGGTAAISQEVQDEVERLGFPTSRLAGASRIETAALIAATFAPDAVSAFVVRSGGPGTAAWADSVTAGAAAAQLRIPILLTTSNGLSDTTRAYLQSSQIRTVIVVGGDAAIDPFVEGQLRDELGLIVTRVGGADRVETSLAMSQLRDLPPGGRAVLFDAYSETGWQGGLVAARHAWLSQAPMLATTATSVPTPVLDHLQQTGVTRLTCVIGRTACDQARADGTGQARPRIYFNPPAGSAISAGENVVISIDDPQRILNGVGAVSSTCGSGDPNRFFGEGSGGFNLSVTPQEDPSGDDPAVTSQPTPSPSGNQGGIGGPTDGATAEPIEPTQGEPADAPVTCTLTSEFQRVSGGDDLVDIASFNVVSLRPRIRVASAPIRAGQPVALQEVSGGLVDTFRWTFGDDSAASTDRHPDHTWAEAGCYDVALRVTSPLEHWFTGNRFTETAVRTVSVDGGPGTSPLVEVLLQEVDDDGVITIRPGEDVQARRSGAVASTATTDSRGRATFADLTPNTYTFRSVNDPETEIDLRVLDDQTLCPELTVAPLGSVTITVTESVDGNNVPVSGATVTLSSTIGEVPAQTTDANGQTTFTDIPAVTYTATAEATGYVTATSSVTVPEGEVGTATITVSPPPPPTPTPTPTATP